MYEIWDLDGTLFNSAGEVRPDVLEYLKNEVETENEKIIIVSSRPISELDATKKTLDEAGVPYAEIHLNDFSENLGPNVVVAFKKYKYEKLIEQYGADAISYVVDNNPEVRAVAQELGLEAYTYEELLAELDGGNGADGGDVEGEDQSGVRKETPMTQEIERRTLIAESIELREDGRTFTGYAALYDSPSAGLGFTEVIKPGAFNRTLSRAQRGEQTIVALYGHDELSFLGSTKSGALQLNSDSRGLKVELKLPETQLGNDLAALFRAGEATAMGMSFGFSVPSKNGERWSTDGTTRELTELRLHEVSLLSGGQTPAYPGTIGLGSVRALAQRLGVEPEIARDAVDALLSGTLDEVRSAILVRAIGGSPEAPAAEPAPDAIIEEVSTVAEVPSQTETTVPASVLVALGEVRIRRVK